MRILRELRTGRHLTLRNVSDGTGVSAPFVSQIERGEATASMPTLRKLAAFYGVPLAYLFEDDSDGVSCVRRGSHTRLSPAHPGVTFELLSPDLNRKIEFLRIVLAPGASTRQRPSPHPGEEVHLVLNGQIEVDVAERRYRLGPGDTIYLSSIIPHRVTNAGSRQAVLITALTPPTPWAVQTLSESSRVRQPRVSARRRAARTRAPESGRRREARR